MAKLSEEEKAKRAAERHAKRQVRMETVTDGQGETGTRAVPLTEDELAQQEQKRLEEEQASKDALGEGDQGEGDAIGQDPVAAAEAEKALTPDQRSHAKLDRLIALMGDGDTSHSDDHLNAVYKMNRIHIGTIRELHHRRQKSPFAFSDGHHELLKIETERLKKAKFI